MKRLTYDFEIGGNHCWQVKGADNLECREVCERQGDNGCKTCPISKAFDRLAAIEDILCDSENEYDLERLAAVYNQRVSMRDEVSERFSLTAKIPLDRLREIAEADREGRCVVLDGKSRDKELIRKLVRLFYWLEDCVKKKDFSPFRIVAGAPENNYPFISAFQRIENEYELEIHLAGKDEEAEAALAKERT